MYIGNVLITIRDNNILTTIGDKIYRMIIDTSITPKDNNHQYIFPDKCVINDVSYDIKFNSRGFAERVWAFKDWNTTPFLFEEFPTLWFTSNYYNKFWIK